MAETIRIDMMKGRAEGTTSLSPESPTNDIATSPRTISPKTAIAIGYGVMVAKQTISTATQEIALGGNEQLAQDITNLVNGVQTGLLAVATGGISLVGEGIGVAAQTVTRVRATNRENRNRAYERQMRGARQNYNGMGGGLG